jgi:hypothetical protein
MSLSVSSFSTLTPTATHAARPITVSHATPFLLLQIRQSQSRQPS